MLFSILYYYCILFAQMVYFEAIILWLLYLATLLISTINFQIAQLLQGNVRGVPLPDAAPRVQHQPRVHDAVRRPRLLQRQAQRRKRLRGSTGLLLLLSPPPAHFLNILSRPQPC
jgi:hypothetical protein